MTAPDIFLSYNREDQAQAKLFADAFAAAGLNVWWDTALTAGEAYDQVTERALKSAKAVVVLWSPRSVESRWVRAEATIADRNKTLVPVMIEPCERPIMFELTQTAELSHWTGDAADRTWVGFLNDVQRFVSRERAALAPMPSLATVAAKSAPAPASAPETLLAVLPFDNLSSDAEMAYFSDGVSDDILGRIMRGSRLRVIGRTSSFQFRGADKPKAAAALGASHVLDGSIRRAGNRVRIAAQLTEAASQTMLWSDKFDRDLEDIFAVQDEISQAIADALNAAFFPAKQAKVDPLAYDLFLRGKQFDSSPEAIHRNIELLEAAVKMEPAFADAWGTLAVQRYLGRVLVPWSERAPIDARIAECASRCLSLDPDNADAIIAELSMLQPFGDYLGHHAKIEQLLHVGRNSANALGVVGLYLEALGRPLEAVTISSRGAALDPLNYISNSIRAMSLWRSGAFEEGRTAEARVVETWPDSHHDLALLILAEAHAGNWAEVDRLTDPARLAQLPLREHRGVVQLVAGTRDPNVETRRAVLAPFIQMIELSGHADAATFLWIAELGGADAAYALLDRTKLGPSGGPTDVLGTNAYRTHMLFPAAYTRLRADPRFVKLCARLGLVEYWLATQKWPDCAEVVPYDFRAECEKYRDYPKDVFLA